MYTKKAIDLLDAAITIEEAKTQTKFFPNGQPPVDSWKPTHIVTYHGKERAYIKGPVRIPGVAQRNAAIAVITKLLQEVEDVKSTTR